MTEQDKEQLNIEISHIFESGANHLRIFEMVENFIDNRYKAINYTHCCTELKTVKQGENLILDNKFDVEVITPESSVLIKYKDKDRLIWVDKQRLKRK